MYFSSKKSSQNPSKMRSGHLKNRCQKHIILLHRVFRIFASILGGLGPPSWSQVGHFWLPGSSLEPLKSNLSGVCAQDASQEAPKWLQKGSQGGPRGRFWSIFDEFGSLFSLFLDVKTDYLNRHSRHHMYLLNDAIT